MQEQMRQQHIPVKVYRTAERLMVTTPMPGLEPENIQVEVTRDGHLVLQGAMRGMLKEVKELLLDEWSVGAYYRKLALPVSINAECASGVQCQRMGQVLNRAVVLAQRAERHASQDIRLYVAGIALDRLGEASQATAPLIELFVGKTAQDRYTVQVGIEHRYPIKVRDGSLVIFEVSIGEPSMGVSESIVGVQRQRAGTVLDGSPILAQGGRGKASKKIAPAIGGIERQRLVKVCHGKLQLAAQGVRHASLAIDARQQ